MGASPSTARSGESQLLAAKVQLLEAEAEAKRAESATARTRAEAEARTHAEAVRAESVRSLLPLAGGVALAALLAVDFYRHESNGFIRRRLLATLRSCRAPQTTTNASPLVLSTLPVAQRPLALGLLPTMVLGPTGCGKSTLLASLARDHAAARTGEPTVFLRLRLPSSHAPLPEGVTSNDPSAWSLAEAHTLMDSVAAQVFRPIGFPLRRALVLSVPRALYMQLATKLGFSADFTSPSSDRVCDTLRMLFDVLEQLHHERTQSAESIPRDEASPVLLVDEVQDLIKVSRLAAGGSRAVFNTLAQLLDMYCVDRGVVRAAVAGSSALLSAGLTVR